MGKKISSLQELRLKYKPILPKSLENVGRIFFEKRDEGVSSPSELKEFFKESYGQSLICGKVGKERKGEPLKVGVVFSGGQASGGHNVIAGLFDTLKTLNKAGRLFGFLGGPSGIVEKKVVELTADMIAAVRNVGGFDLIGSGRTKIETEEQFQAVKKNVVELDLDGLVIIGGDDSNTNAALLAEYFLQEKIKTRVIGVPKTIDGDLRGDFLELSFGFDSACRVYSEMIGNIARDAMSAKKYYHFIRLMGRSASHIALECALATQPNLTLIGEEIFANKKTLKDVVQEIADLIVRRNSKGKNYGVILVPEGLIEFIPEIKTLIAELNGLLAQESTNLAKMNSFAKSSEKITFLISLLSKDSKNVFSGLPEKIQEQLLLERDPHGNVQVSLIETEKLLMELVQKELKNKGVKTFNGLNHFFGYEGRAGFPSNFDANYCYGLGFVAASLIKEGVTGYLSSLYNLTKDISQWEVLGVPLVSMMNLEKRHGKMKPVIKKALVDLKGKAFLQFAKMRIEWQEEDCFLYPGPIQYFGDPKVANALPLSLQ